MSREVWKDVVGYEGIYQVTSLGRVKSLKPGKRRHGHILKPRHNRDGYLRVVLYRDRKRKTVLVHRLVLERFIGHAPSPKHEGNHRNGDKHDNRVENLEWVTASENCKHAFRALGRKAVPLRGEANDSAILTDRKVRQIRKLYAAGHSQRKLGEIFGVSHRTIGKIVNRESWKHVGGPAAPKIHRRARGEAHGSAKLTEEDVVKIRKLSATGHSQQELGRMFGVHHSTIGDIVNRKLWKHVP